MKTLTFIFAIIFNVLVTNTAPLEYGDKWTGMTEKSSYLEIRNLANSYYENDSQPSARKLAKRFSANATRPDGAVPFWFNKQRIPCITVQVGTPPQQIDVLVDTGSGDTWIRGPDSSVATPFSSTLSSTWQFQNKSCSLAYMDTSGCTVSMASEMIKIGDKALSGVDLGIAKTREGSFVLKGTTFSSDCSHFSEGILGLSRTCSPVLRAYLEQRPDAMNIFSFAYQNQETGEGENLFSLGGYAGLDPTEIVWMDHKANDKAPTQFAVDLPYVWYKGHRVDAPRGHSAMVDTGSNIGILPKTVMREVFWYERAFRRARSHRPNGEHFITHIYDSSVYRGDRSPAMAIKMGGTEWLSEIVNWDTVEDGTTDTNGPPLVGPFHLPTFLSSGEFPFVIDHKLIPSVVGGTFLSKLRGLVFDFTPNKERVGFVPRYKFTTTTGLVNPLGMRSGATSVGLGGIYSKTGYLAGSLFVALFLYISV
jgi:hypothetical protein